MQKKKTSKTQSKGAKTSSIVPLGDRVLVRPYTEDEAAGRKSTSGIYIPETVSKEKSAQGKIIAVGDGRYENGKLIPIRVKVGETVVFSKYGYDEVESGGEEYYLIKEENILAVIK